MTRKEIEKLAEKISIRLYGSGDDGCYGEYSDGMRDGGYRGFIEGAELRQKEIDTLVTGIKNLKVEIEKVLKQIK